MQESSDLVRSLIPHKHPNTARVNQLVFIRALHVNISVIKRVLIGQLLISIFLNRPTNYVCLYIDYHQVSERKRNQAAVKKKEKEIQLLFSPLSTTC